MGKRPRIVVVQPQHHYDVKNARIIRELFSDSLGQLTLKECNVIRESLALKISDAFIIQKIMLMRNSVKREWNEKYAERELMYLNTKTLGK